MMSKKVQLKNVLRGVVIGLALFFIAGLLFYYFYFYQPLQGMKRQEKILDEWGRMLSERQKEQQMKQLQEK